MNKVIKLKCELCGTEKDVDIVCGGPFGQLCKPCFETVCKVIVAYNQFLSEMPFRIVANTIVKTGESEIK